MGKQIRVDEDFVEELRSEYKGSNDMARLINWKHDSKKDRLIEKLDELIDKIENLDVDGSSTSKEWTRSDISDIAEDIVYTHMDN